jgi:hypothetical protein
LNFDALIAAGRQRVLAPAETINTDVLFTVQQGVDSVSHIGANGTIRSKWKRQYANR